MTPTADDSSMLDAATDTAAGFQVSISNDQQILSVDERLLRDVAARVLQEEAVTSAQISIALINDAAIHAINRKFLHHDYPTDVISFRLNDPDAGTSAPGQSAESNRPLHIDGEVVISAETALQTARDVGCLPMHELALYLVHGLLHLCGYDDQTDADRQQMRKREQSLLHYFDIPANYEC